MSFNIRYENKSAEQNNWFSRKNKVFKILENSLADFIGLQEVTANQRDDITKNLINYSYFGRSRSQYLNQDEEVGILYRKDKWFLVKGGHIWFSREQFKPDFGSFCPRMMTWCMFERFGKSTNKVALFNCHFDHKSMNSKQ